MRLTATPISGILIAEAESQHDERGYFARTFDESVFAASGISFMTRQCSTSFNDKRGTLRGLHYQLSPAEEMKLVRCTRGAIFDVAVDLRRQSPTFQQWFGLELTADNLQALLVPRGCAHGFLTLLDASEVFYQIDAGFAPELARGIRWNDPAFRIDWPIEPAVILPRDAAYSDFIP
jgi:dTDP-4-dehydrorhamnose 3,5-epimerase